MIKFFRNTRQKLLLQDNTRKYLIYAVGEITLVMIGILLALQVNNWNEERIRKADEMELLLNVQTDFEDALREFSNLNSLRVTISEVIDEVINKREDLVTFYDKEQLDSLFAILEYQPTYNNQSGSLDVLLTSGKISLIKDDTLKAMLLNWPGLVDDMIEGELAQVEYYSTYYTPIIQSYLSMNEVYRQFNLANLTNNKLNRFNRAARMTSDYVGLLKYPELENILVVRDFYTSIAFIETENLVQTADKIIGRIQQLRES